MEEKSIINRKNLTEEQLRRFNKLNIEVGMDLSEYI